MRNVRWITASVSTDEVMPCIVAQTPKSSVMLCTSKIHAMAGSRAMEVPLSCVLLLLNWAWIESSVRAVRSYQEQQNTDSTRVCRGRLSCTGKSRSEGHLWTLGY